jgi:hypothetical protein
LHVMVDNAECLSVMYVIRIYKVYIFLNLTDSILCIHNYNYYNHVPHDKLNWVWFKDDGLEFAMFGKAKQQVWLNFGKSNSLKTIKPKGLNKITKLSSVYHEGHDCNSCNYEYII